MIAEAAIFGAVKAKVEANAPLAAKFGSSSGTRRVYRAGANAEETPQPPFMRVSFRANQGGCAVGNEDVVDGVLDFSLFSHQARAFNTTAKGFEGMDDVQRLLVAEFSHSALTDPDGRWVFSKLGAASYTPGPVENRDYLHQVVRYRVLARRV